MSANIILRLPRHDAILIASDTAVYTKDGIVREFRSKQCVVPHWPGITAGRGTAISQDLITAALAERFISLDDALAGIEVALPEIVAGIGLPLKSELLLAGWSESRQAPVSYMIQTPGVEFPDNSIQDDREARAGGFMGDPYRLVELPPLALGPALRFDATVDCGFDGVADDISMEEASRLLRLLIEAQRQQADRNGCHWVGGSVDLGIVTPTFGGGVIIHAWAEDAVDSPISPVALDWEHFRVSLGMSPGLGKCARDELKAAMAALDLALAESA